MRPIRITPPASLPIDLERIKGHGRIDATESDTLLMAYVQAATDHLDGWQGLLGRCMVEQVWRIDIRDGISGSVVLPFPDVSSVIARDASGATLGDIPLAEGAAGTVADFGNDRATQIDMTVGFGGPDAVPEPLKVAVSMLATFFYDNPGSADGEGIPMAIDRLIAPYRWARI